MVDTTERLSIDDSRFSPHDTAARHLHVEGHTSSGHGFSSARTRLWWTGLGVAGLVALIGVSAWAVYPVTSRTDFRPGSRRPLLFESALAFSPSVVDPRSHLGRIQKSVRSTDPRQQLLVAPRGKVLPAVSLPMSGEDKYNFQSTTAGEATTISGSQLVKLQSLIKDPLAKVKEYGVSGVVSYAIWGELIYSIGAVVGVLGFYVTFGHWPNFADPEDAKRLAAETATFVSFAIFAIPLRIGLAISTAPWVSENIIKRFAGNFYVNKILQKFGMDSEVNWQDFAEDFQVVSDKSGVAVQGPVAKQIFEFVRTTPLNEGRNVEIDKHVSIGTNGEPTLLAKWKIELQESDVQHGELLEQIKKAGAGDFPVQIECSSTFTRNDDGKVSSMSIGAWSVNGQEIAIPDFKDLSEADSAAVQKWAKEMVAL